MLWEGASVPIIPALAKAAGAEPLLIGFGLDEDLIHSPNESFSLKQFEDGYLYTASLLSVL
jgi:acetylornithine deacetylase/succinyl-diaminopimelate desuccinylase-like protein